MKARDNGAVANQAVYLAIGINLRGHKEVLGRAARPRAGSRPGASGGAWDHAMSSSVVILQVHVISSIRVVPECDAPISGHLDRVGTFAIALEWVKSKVREIHVFGACGGVQPVEQAADTRRVLGINTPMVSGLEEPLISILQIDGDGTRLRNRY